jgi:zinc and cadmium transporter
MGDYGILVYAGFERKISIIINFIAAFAVVIGGFFGSIFIGFIGPMTGWMIAFSVGALLFLSATELIPEMHKEKDRRKTLLEIVMLLFGLLKIYSLGIIFPE